MTTFRRSRNYQLVRKIVTHPKIYRASLLSDFAPSAAHYRVPSHPSVWYVIPRDNGMDLGVGIFMPHTPIWYEAHMCLLPVAWGEGSAELTLDCVRWFREQSGCRTLTAHVPSYNRLMHSLAKRIGMTRVGVLADSVMQHGMLCDQTIFSLAI